MKRQNAIYARQSIDKKESLSIEGQIEKCREKVPKAIIYEDKGYSGKNTERPALQKLIQDIESDKIELVVVYKIDRISRSVVLNYSCNTST